MCIRDSGCTARTHQVVKQLEVPLPDRTDKFNIPFVLFSSGSEDSIEQLAEQAGRCDGTKAAEFDQAFPCIGACQQFVDRRVGFVFVVAQCRKLIPDAGDVESAMNGHAG